MDLNKDAKLTYDEFKEGSKQDPTIVQVRPCLTWRNEILINRHYRYMTVWYRFKVMIRRVQIVDVEIAEQEIQGYVGLSIDMQMMIEDTSMVLGAPVFVSRTSTVVCDCLL